MTIASSSAPSQCLESRPPATLDLALIGNCTISALIDSRGSIVWCCMPRFVNRDRMFRPVQLVRRVRPLAGHPRVRFTVRPRGDWGASPPALTRGSHHLRFLMPQCTLRLNTGVPLTYPIDSTWFTLHSAVSLMLGLDETLAGSVDDTARKFEEMTAIHWRH